MLEDLLKLAQSTRDEWPTPKELPSHSIDDRLDQLRCAANQCGIVLTKTYRVVPAGRTLCSLALEEWTDDPSLESIEWNRFHDRIDEIETAIESKNPTSSISRTKVKKAADQGPEGAELKLGTALIAHHKYERNSILNDTPVGVAELARNAAVAKSTASLFFKKMFPTIGYRGYRRDLATGATKTRIVLQQLSGESVLALGFYGSDPDKPNSSDD